MNDRKQVYLYHRNRRQTIGDRLRDKLGHYCHRCSSPDKVLSGEDEHKYLKLFIFKRNSEDLKRFTNNTVQIYDYLVKGKLPIERVTLVCDECAYEIRKEEKNDSND